MANDEIYDVEDMDMDADIQRKQELIEEIKSLDLNPTVLPLCVRSTT